jgi:hypothetical protein
MRPRAGQKFSIIKSHVHELERVYCIQLNSPAVEFLKKEHTIIRVSNPANWCSCCTRVAVEVPHNLYSIFGSEHYILLSKIRLEKSEHTKCCCDWQYCRNKINV